MSEISVLVKPLLLQKLLRKDTPPNSSIKTLAGGFSLGPNIFCNKVLIVSVWPAGTLSKETPDFKIAKAINNLNSDATELKAKFGSFEEITSLSINLPT